MTALDVRDGAAANSPAGRRAAATRRPAARRWSLGHWPTPVRIRAFTFAAVALAVCLAAVSAVLLAELNGSFAAIGRTDAPEADSTASLYFSLNDMDAQIANVLIVGAPAQAVTEADRTLAADRTADAGFYASDVAAVSQDLNQAAVAESGNAAAEQQLSVLGDKVAQYEGLAADAMLTAQQAHSPAGPAPAAALGYFQQATDLMQSQILPSAQSLTTAGDAHLDVSYASGKSAALTGLAWAAALLVLLLAVLAGLQAYLSRRFRRLVNPALALATLLVLIGGIGTVARFYGEYTHLHVARFDSFESIQALTVARGVSQNANADESRYLVDPARGAQYQASFLAKTQQIAGVGSVQLSGYAPALQADITAYQRNSDVRFTGYLGTEFRNITFPGERQAAYSALLGFEGYEQDDHTLRTMATTDMQAAVLYDQGTAANQSDGAFIAYDKAIQSDIAINQAAFNAAVAAGQGASGASALAFVVLTGLLAAALTYLGVRPRLREYR